MYFFLILYIFLLVYYNKYVNFKIKENKGVNFNMFLNLRPSIKDLGCEPENFYYFLNECVGGK